MRGTPGRIDATQGVIWRQLVAFFLPLWLGTFFQQLYNTVDSVVVGRFVGTAALAAVGCTGTVVALTVGIFNGISSGAVVVIAQQFGARRPDRVRQGVHTAMLLGVVLGAVFMAAGFALAPWVLRVMDTTPDTLGQAQLYLRIYFLGMIPNVVYNMATGVLRAIGDSRRPLYFLMAASVCNIALDLTLVLGFHLGVLGVAVATVASQLLSAVLAVVYLMRAKGQSYQLFPRSIRLERHSLRAILRLGTPAALQSITYSASNLVIQASINHFGTDTMAAWTAYGKMDVIYWMTISSLGLAVTSFVGQNYGAGKLERLRQGVRVSLGLGYAVTALMCVLLMLFCRPILHLFLTEDAVVEIGMTMTYFLVPCYLTYVPIEILAGTVRAAGKALPPMLISVFGVCGLRLVWLLCAVPLHRTVPMVELSYPITWSVTSIALSLYYWKGRWLAPPRAEPGPQDAEAPRSQ